jgi:hypothetical protein
MWQHVWSLAEETKRVNLYLHLKGLEMERTEAFFRFKD